MIKLSHFNLNLKTNQNSILKEKILFNVDENRKKLFKWKKSYFFIPQLIFYLLILATYKLAMSYFIENKLYKNQSKW